MNTELRKAIALALVQELAVGSHALYHPTRTEHVRIDDFHDLDEVATKVLKVISAHLLGE